MNLLRKKSSSHLIYSKYSEHYDRFFGRSLHPGRQKAISALAPLAGDRVLEVGFGTGLSFPLYPKKCHVVGIDFSMKMLSRAQRRCQGKERCALLQMDAKSLSFHDNSFDHVIASYVLTAVPYPRKVLREMLRVCKPGGHVVILNHTPPKSRLLRRGEKLLSPICHKIGWTLKIDVEAILSDENIFPREVQKVNLFGIHKLILFNNPV